MKRLRLLAARPAARLLTRLGLWSAAFLLLARAAPLSTLDAPTRGRLLYALLLSRRSALTRAAYVRLLRRNLDASPDANFDLAAMAQRLNRPTLATRLYRRTLTLDAQPHQHHLARTMADFLTLQASGQLRTDLAALVQTLGLKPNQTVVLVTAGHNYLELFHLWRRHAAQHIAQHTGDRIVALALDPLAAQVLAPLLPNSVLDLSRWFTLGPTGRLHHHSRNVLWILRVLLLAELSARHHPILSIDLDAILTGDLDAMLRALPPADIIAQQDFSIPVEVARKHGFVLCCGFMVFYPTPATQAFLGRFAQRTAIELDDQLALNHLVAEAGITRRTQTGGHLGFDADGIRWLCPNPTLVSRDLHTGHTVRHFHQQGQSIQQLETALRQSPS